MFFWGLESFSARGERKAREEAAAEAKPPPRATGEPAGGGS